MSNAGWQTSGEKKLIFVHVREFISLSSGTNYASLGSPIEDPHSGALWAAPAVPSEAGRRKKLSRARLNSPLVVRAHSGDPKALGGAADG